MINISFNTKNQTHTLDRNTSLFILSYLSHKIVCFRTNMQSDRIIDGILVPFFLVSVLHPYTTGGRQAAPANIVSPADTTSHGYVAINVGGSHNAIADAPPSRCKSWW